MSRSFTFLHTTVFPENTFDTFYTKSVSLRETLSNAVEQKKPLTIIGDIQTGKTHVLHALAQHAHQINLLYIATTGHLLVKGALNDHGHSLSTYLHNFDCLFIDDVHTLLRSKTAQNVLLTLLESGKTMIATTQPHHYAQLNPKLFDLLKGALSITLAPPSHAHILEHYAQTLDVVLSSEEHSALQAHQTDISAKKALVSMKKRKGLSILNTLLTMRHASSKKFLPEQIIHALCASQAIARHLLCSKRPQKRIKELQDLCIFLCHMHGAQLSTLCALFNRKHYVSIHNARQRAKALISENSSIFKVLRDVEKHLTPNT